MNLQCQKLPVKTVETAADPLKNVNKQLTMTLKELKELRPFIKSLENTVKLLKVKEASSLKIIGKLLKSKKASMEDYMPLLKSLYVIDHKLETIAEEAQQDIELNSEGLIDSIENFTGEDVKDYTAK